MFGDNTSVNGYSDSSEPHVNEKQRRKKYKLALVIVSFIALACFVTAMFFIFKDTPQSTGPHPVKQQVTILAFNDIYELLPVGGLGGFPRLATLRKQLVKEDPNLFTVLAGDFYSPSALGVAPIVDEYGQPTPLYGKQIVDAMNHMGSPPELFLTTFGNHEFDVTDTAFYLRIKESKFHYISTNVYAMPPYTFPDHVQPFAFREVDGITIAFISASVYVNDMKTYAKILEFQDTIKTIRETIAAWKEQGRTWDILIAITHLSLAQDSELALEVPEIDFIMGGHEHENWRIDRGTADHPLPITKADANGKTAFVHRLYFDKARAHHEDANRFGSAYHTPGALVIESELLQIDDTYADDPEMVQRTQYWTDLAFDAFEEQGLRPTQPMGYLTRIYNCQDKATRGKISDIGSFIADANYEAIQKETDAFADALSIFNIGSVRVDDILPKGPLIEYDALRILPFGGDLKVITLDGAALATWLSRASGLLGDGMWIGFNPTIIRPNDECKSLSPSCRWLVKEKPIVDDHTYSVIVTGYMSDIAWNTYFDSQEHYKVVYTAKTSVQTSLIEHFRREYPVQS